MDDVKKKVLLDLFASPWVIVPLVGGLSAWLLSWGMDGNTTLNMVGLAGVLAGMGIQASRLIFGIEDLTKKAHSYVTEQEKLAQEQKLDQLMARLKQDEDPRSEECLKRLRTLYTALALEAPHGHTATMFREKVDQLFQAAVRQLERSLELWEKARRLPGNTSRLLLTERKKAIDEVVLTVNHLSRTVEQYHAFQLKDSDHELAKLREELDRTIEVARRTEEVIDALDAPQRYDDAEYER
ncbi:hypothetical protein [Blastopirellula marina]|uniref:5-bromo-4-chloroindolyl phosphate hydrolysis protein n=1 Tax=Blastopirellula marina TaxID=124 RepID=A0A2S8GBQ4_9BACT|nr:hypothetical protein [Blastopirellula marina]PQO41888.1 hypothetical protein C5Y98_02300 [Blastopirellula marina]PTL46246.1 hypothetical protein C5Y97_02300 [Blastopirellula marina]